MHQLPIGFNLICKIQPEITGNGKVREFYPHKQYDNKENKLLLRDGFGPFCKFRIPNIDCKKTGVYLLYINNVIKYVGECEDLLNRFNAGYGHISPRNCFTGGQATNCRINSYILQSFKDGEEIYLYFMETDERFFVEGKLIKQLQPQWNRQGGKNMDKKFDNKELHFIQAKQKQTKISRDKYLPLKEYLMNSQKTTEILTFKEIETIIESNLPKSAYTYAAWWSNGGHSHADSWLDAGWKVEEFVFGDYAKFKKQVV